MQAMKGKTMVDISWSREEVLKYIRPKVKIGQLVQVDYKMHRGEDCEVLQKVKGGWKVITQRPVYTHLHVLRY